MAGTLLVAGLASAQPAQQLLVEMRRTYQDEPIVYLHRNTTIRIQRVGNELVSSREVDEEKLVLKELSGTAHENTVHYSSSFQTLEDLDIYTMTPQGNGYKRIRVDKVEHRDVRDGMAFYDDQRLAAFLYPAMVSGAIGHLSYTLQCKDARFSGGHFFEGVHPTVESTFTVISDPGVAVDLRMFHMPDSSFERTVTTERGRTVQRLVMRKVPSIKFETNAPSARAYSPHVLLLVGNEGVMNDERAKADLYKWFWPFVQDMLLPVPANVAQLSDSITNGISEPRAKAAAIYTWVQQHVRYVAFEDGMNGFIPAKPEEVYRVRYGDCKGMSSLLRALLQAAGMNARLAWIGTRDIPYDIEQLPSASATDHMIVALDLADTTLFLDATAHDIGLGVPSGFIQGKQALIAVDASTWRLERVPEMPADFSTVSDSVTATVDGTTISGTGIMRATGYDRYRLLDWWRSTRPDRRGELLRHVLMKGSNAFLLDTFEVSGTDREADVFEVRYAFKIPGAVVRSGRSVFLPTCLVDPWEDLRTKEDRKLPVEMQHRSVHRNALRLKLPEAATCTVLPPPLNDGGKGFNVRAESRCADNELISSSTFTMDTLLIDDELEAWRKFNLRQQKALGSRAVLELQ